jgi:MSHA biogenesis protein MshL
MKNRALIFLMFVIVLGCAARQTIDKKPPIVASPQPPPPVKEKLEELTVSPIEEETKEPERLYTLSFRKADVHEMLTILSRESKLNIIIDPDVRGEVSVDLKDVTLGKALDCLLTPLGLEYKREANFIRVSPISMQTRMFMLNYPSTERGGSGMVSGTSGRAGKEGGSMGSFIKVETSDTANLWKEIEEGLKAISSQGGKLVINKVSGSILATDFPQNLARMAQFLETIEGSAQRQVTIQARIMEVILSDEYQMGLNWAAVTVGDFPILSQTINPPTKLFQIGISDHDFSALLDAMSKQGKTDILSSPRVSALNNQPAVIKVATEDVYWEREFSYTEVPGQAVGFSKPRWITEGILLKVTPQIGPDRLIIMDIHPSVTEKVGESVSSEGDIAPILAVRETNTVVKVRDGQTIIIAGLLQKREMREVTSVPFLGRIPLLGAVFRKTVEEKKKTELVIMLTPTIVVGNETQGQSIRGLSAEWREVR